MTDVHAPKLPGVIYTFYSYKGGVGRSMAVANVGVLLALAGKRVLLVDWDLEAPGLERFFDETTRLRGDSRSVPGILDLLESRMQGESLSWKDCLLRAEFLGTSLDIISAGSKTPDYRKRIQKLDWDVLYRAHNVGELIDELREEWRSPANYDFVLVDSRTGMTDIGDVCTVLLPDAIVLMFVTNHQNVEGIREMMTRAIKVRKSLPLQRNKLLGIPLAARDEIYSEYEKALAWREIFAKEFADLYSEWLPREVSPADALHKMFIPYVTNWSFGECLPVLGGTRETQDPTTIGAAYKRVANLLSSGLDWYSVEGAVPLETLQGAQVELMRVREESAAALAEQQELLEAQARSFEEERRRLQLEQQVRDARLVRRYSLPLVWVAGLALVVGLSILLARFLQPDPVASLVHMGWTVQTGYQGVNLKYSGEQPPFRESAAFLSGLRVRSVSITDVSGIGGIQSWAGFDTLSSLDLSGPLRDLTELSSLKSLTKLKLAGTKADDITPLATLQHLSVLDLSDTDVTDLLPLSHLSDLTELDLSDTPVASLRPLSGLPHLAILNLSVARSVAALRQARSEVPSNSTPSGSDQKYLTPLEDSQSLRELDIRGLDVADISPLLRLPGLSTLKISEAGGSGIVSVPKGTADVLQRRDIKLFVEFR